MTDKPTFYFCKCNRSNKRGDMTEKLTFFFYIAQFFSMKNIFIIQVELWLVKNLCHVMCSALHTLVFESWGIGMPLLKWVLEIVIFLADYLELVQSYKISSVFCIIFELGVADFRLQQANTQTCILLNIYKVDRTKMHSFPILFLIAINWVMCQTSDLPCESQTWLYIWETLIL